jgi:replicative DNA helicase
MNATLAQRQPPQNFEAEMAVLGAIMANNAAWLQAAETLKPEHFADPLHGRLFEALGRLIERGQVVSAFTLKTYAESDEGLKAVGGGSYLAKLLSASVHALDVPSAARLVRDCATRRGLIAVLSEALPSAYDEAQERAPAEQIEEVERRLYDLADGVVGDGFKPFSRPLTEALKSAEAAHSRPGGMAGLSTGLRDVDELLGGLHRSDLIILAGRPSMGKSALASNVGFAAASNGGTVGFFSLEMSAEQLATRIVAEQAGVQSEKVRRGQLSTPEMDRVIDAAGRLESLQLFMDDTPALSIGGIRTRARRLKRQHGLGLIIIDYLQLIESSKQRRAENRVQEVSEITRGLKTLAKELDVPVLALSQLSRAVESRADKRPQLSDLRESGSIEQDADVVAFIYREEYYLERGAAEDRAKLADVAGKAELHVAKQRHGPTGLVRLTFDGPTTRFSDIDRSDQ